MKTHRKKNPVSPMGMKLKKRIMGTRSRAKFVGYIYLLATIALAAAVICVPMLPQDLAPIRITNFWKAFTKIDKATEGWLIKIINAGLYALVLLVAVINVFRSFACLSWLHKKSATKTDGFNRNIAAMERMGRLFSGSFFVMLVGYFFIAMLCKTTEAELWLAITLGACVVIHLFACVVGAKHSYFNLEEGEVIERKRTIGRFVPFFRNLLQLATVFGIMFFFLKMNEANAIINPLLEKGAFNDLLKDVKGLIVLAAQVLSLLSLLVLTKHATGLTEYDIEGIYAPGMKNFRVFSFFVFLFMGTAAVCEEFVIKAGFKAVVLDFIHIAFIAFLMFVIELLLRKRPKELVEKEVKVKPVDEEISLQTVSQKYIHTVAQTPAKEDKKGKKGAEETQPASAPASAPTMLPACWLQQPAAQPQAQAQAQQAPANGYPVPQPYPFPVPQPYYQPIMQPQVQQAPQQPAAPYVNILPVVSFRPEEPKPVATVAKEEKEEEVEEVQKPVTEGKKVEVACPHCGRKLRVNSGATYHRCPVCDKVFELRKSAKPKQ